MMWCFWSAKGGSGCSVVAAATAVRAARTGADAVLVDLGGGDVATLLGIDEPSRGLGDWFAASNPPPDGLARLEVPVGRGLRLLAADCRDQAGPPADRFELLARMLAVDPRLVIVDLGDVGTGPAWPSEEAGWRGGSAPPVLARFISSGAETILVTRLCYLSLRRAIDMPRPDRVVVVVEPERALRVPDVVSALGNHDVATIRWDPGVARAADAGLLSSRLPRPLQRLPVPDDSPRTGPADASGGGA